MDDYFKLPRLFTDAALRDGGSAPMTAEQAHYLKNVLRRNDGDSVRLFNGREGEWLATLSNLTKKGGTALLTRLLRPQPVNSRRIHLYAAPIKKTALDWMIEKAVELGVTDIHPVLTQNTEVRKINAERLTKQVFEAAEQCERLEIPVLHEMIPLSQVTGGKFPLLACVERVEAGEIAARTPKKGDIGVLIGPEGGFTVDERAFLTSQADIIPVTLGDSVLRAETAACYALIAVQIA